MEFFRFYSDFTYIRVEFKAVNNVNIRQSVLNLLINQLPFNGSCMTANTFIGFAQKTDFNIICKDWFDPDPSSFNSNSQLQYEYYTRYGLISSEFNIIAFDYNGNITCKLPLGDSSDDFKIYISIKIIDIDNGWTWYHINDSLKVTADMNIAVIYLENIFNFDTSSEIIKELSKPNLAIVGATMISFLSILNNLNVNKTEKNTTTFSSIELTSARNTLINFAVKMNVSGISDLKIVTSVMQSLTLKSDEISFETGTKGMTKTKELALFMADSFGQISISEMKTLSKQIVNTVGNILSSVDSLTRNSNQTFSVTNLVNIVIEKKLIVESITKALSPYLNINEEAKINTENIQIELKKKLAKDINSTSNLSNGEFKFSSFCELYEPSSNSSNQNCYNSIIVQQVT